MDQANLEHAHYLIEHEGSCDGGYGMNCDTCFVPQMSEIFEDCLPEIALEKAEQYAADHDGCGICKSIW